jgi:hypothetical protein
MHSGLDYAELILVLLQNFVVYPFLVPHHHRCRCRRNTTGRSDRRHRQSRQKLPRSSQPTQQFYGVAAVVVLVAGGGGGGEMTLYATVLFVSSTEHILVCFKNFLKVLPVVVGGKSMAEWNRN